jgi:uncharacterized protein
MGGELMGTNEINSPYISVQGVGEVKVKPDEAVITVGVITEAKTAKVAQQENATKSTAVIHALRMLGISEKDIATTSYTISKQVEYIEGKAVEVGYMVRHELEVTVRNLLILGEVYDRAVEAGANVSKSLRFQLSNEESFYLEALNKALKSAKKKANQIAKTSKASIYQMPYRVIEEAQHKFRPIRTMQIEDTAISSTPIMEKEVEITAKVNIYYLFAHQI